MLGTEALDVTQGERGRERMGLPALGGAERISVLDRSMCYYINRGKSRHKSSGIQIDRFPRYNQITRKSNFHDIGEGSMCTSIL